MNQLAKGTSTDSRGYRIALLICAGLSLCGCQDRPRPPVQELTLGQRQEEELSLDKEQREFLWTVEHHGLMLSKQGFLALANALSSADEKALDALLSPDFTGAEPEDPREVKIATSYVQVTRQTDAGKPPRALDRQAFLKRLLGYRAEFSSPPKVKLALQLLSPVDRKQMDGPWQGTAVLRMWGETAPGQPAETALSLKYRIPRPTNESMAGGWLRSCAIVQSLVGRAPRFLMRDVTAERGVHTKDLNDAWVSKQRLNPGVWVTDFDRDGYLDMLIIDGYYNATLYRGGPAGKFTDVTAQQGLKSDQGGGFAAFADLDGDGWEDLLMNSRVYRNDHGKGFRDVTDSSNLPALFADAYIVPDFNKPQMMPPLITGVVVGDYDLDGKLDLYFTRQGPGKQGNSWVDGKAGWDRGNVLLRNLGNWQFQDTTRHAGAAVVDRSVFSAAFLDINNDGWPDIYVPNEFGNGVLLVNLKNGRFREEKIMSGPSDSGSMGLATGDIDNDGNIDLYLANMYSKAGKRVFANLLPDSYPRPIMDTIQHLFEGSQLYLNHGDGKFQKAGWDFQIADVGWAYGSVLADMDNDGFLDLYATGGFYSQNRNEPDG